jgi:ABC-type transporter Mla subunit MlaD
MEYVKWNYIDLAAQNEAATRHIDELRRLNEELRDTLGALDKQILSYPEISNAFEKAAAGSEEAAHTFGACIKALDRIVDIYRAAELKTKALSESLPTGAEFSKSAADAYKAPAAANMSGASGIFGNATVMEDWLSSLVYRDEAVP